MYTLAKRIANFIWENGDWYELRDKYDTFGELLADTLQSLADKAKRKAIIQWLADCETETEYAQKLITEVEAI